MYFFSHRLFLNESVIKLNVDSVFEDILKKTTDSIRRYSNLNIELPLL
jgi:hypothetical protein